MGLIGEPNAQEPCELCGSSTMHSLRSPFCFITLRKNMGWFRRFMCNLLDSHRVRSKGKWLGGDNYRSRCKDCGRLVLWSSSGWFAMGEHDETD